MLMGEAIEYLLPGAQHSGYCDDGTRASFDALEWNDTRPKPKWEAVQAAMLLDAPHAPRDLISKYQLLAARTEAVADDNAEAVAAIDEKLAALPSLLPAAIEER